MREPAGADPECPPAPTRHPTRGGARHARHRLGLTLSARPHPPATPPEEEHAMRDTGWG